MWSTFYYNQFSLQSFFLKQFCEIGVLLAGDHPQELFSQIWLIWLQI